MKNIVLWFGIQHCCIKLLLKSEIRSIKLKLLNEASNDGNLFFFLNF